MENERNTQLKFDGKGGDLLGIYLFNALATIATLGIYYFWATVRARKYLNRHLVFMDQRFDFHATGKEKFIGFLKAALLFAIAAVVYYAWKTILGLFIPAEWAFVFSIIPIYLVILILLPFVIVGSFRFFLSRTSYNNIRFHFSGHPIELVKIFVPGVIFSVLSFGFYIPWFLIRLRAFYTDNSYYGSAGFKFNGKGSELFWIYFKGILLFLPTFGLYYSWLKANVQNYYWNHTTFNGIKVDSNLKGEDILIYIILSYFLIIVTLGIAFPWVSVIWIKLYMEAISLEVEPDLSAIRPEFDSGASPVADGMESIASMADSISGFLG
ncbi:PF05987 domain protein [Leptospira fainei serovar Hurstbridge str. BUT 6]|uniref:PF05987 domain protein n=1 Tax=Leptospira fainei serovar Hurstbridge str. BUT 6 TaxID=1193011 RepID=S3UW10_9LEPT|nr:DUF898 family protein [Leptospira fainei]EPG73443.1 PF05987 domain protein [Leptospira fainei serovar Hurstbridge str. BUT 6]